jgi:hypothetical protein
VNRNATRYTPGTEPTVTAILQYHRDLWSTQQQYCPNAKGLDAAMQKSTYWEVRQLQIDKFIPD